MQEDVVLDFAKALVNAKRNLTYCSVCGHITDQDPCYICEDTRRDQSVICVVQDPKDVIAMEKMKEYNGLYHVLHMPFRQWTELDRRILKFLIY